MQFPHCDQRILHAPGECKYCDDRPEWQELRKAWGILFTGQSSDPDSWTRQLPCPSDYNRPKGSMSDARQWGGNLPAPPGVEPIGTDYAMYEVYPTDPRLHDEQLRRAMRDRARRDRRKRQVKALRGAFRRILR